jgi:hypothetical protein
MQNYNIYEMSNILDLYINKEKTNLVDYSQKLQDRLTQKYMGQEEGRALRYNEGKLNWGLVDFKCLEPMVKVLEYSLQD